MQSDSKTLSTSTLSCPERRPITAGFQKLAKSKTSFKKNKINYAIKLYRRYNWPASVSSVIRF